METIRTSSNSPELARGLSDLGALAEEYGGLGTTTGDVVSKLRTLRGSELFNAEVEVAYRDAMREIDPFRVVAVKPALQASVYAYGPLYIVLLAVQQLLPKFFLPAYFAAAALAFAPIILAVANS